jgi:hypothetical protein
MKKGRTMTGRPFIKVMLPRASHLLVRVIKRENAKSRKLPTWRERQITNFLTVLNIMVSELDRARRKQRISTLAWAARSLLELSIWSEYCCGEEEKAKRFLDDLVRDFYGLSKAIIGTDGQKSDYAELDTALDKLADFMKTQGVEKLGDDFKSVRKAADELGKEDFFLNHNKILSKLAHPTALMVQSPKALKPDKVFTNIIFDDGVRFAIASLEHIRDFTVKTFPTNPNTVTSSLLRRVLPRRSRD